MPIYQTTKAALHAFSIVQRTQLAPVEIRVIEIIPPAVESELNSEGRRIRRRMNAPYMMAPTNLRIKHCEKWSQTRMKPGWNRKGGRVALISWLVSFNDSVYYWYCL